MNKQFTIVILTLALLYSYTSNAAPVLWPQPIKPLILYKPPPLQPTAHLDNIVTAGIPILKEALTGFKGSFTPMSIGMSVGSSIIAYGVMSGLQELRVQAGLNTPQYTLPNPFGTVGSLQDSYSIKSQFGPGTNPTTGVVCTLPFVFQGTTSSLASQLNTKKVEYQTCQGVSQDYYSWSSPLPGVLKITVNGVQSNQAITYIGQNPCADGYILDNQGLICLQSDTSAIKYPFDSRPSYIPTPNGIVADPRDPDNTSSGSLPMQDVVGTDSYGNPVRQSITSNPSGGVDIQRQTQSEDANHNPIVQQDNISTNSFGKVTHSSTILIGNTTIDNSTTTPIDVSGLNKEATQLEIKKLLNPDPAPDTSHTQDQLDQKMQDAKDIIINTSTDLSTPPFGVINPTHYWTYSSGQCNPITFDAGRFGTFSLASFCQIYDTHIRALLVFILWVGALVHAYYYWMSTLIEMRAK